MSPDITLVHALFISKDPVEEKLMTPYFPLGLLYVAAALRQRGYTVDVFDCAFREDYSEFESYMRRVRPPVVGITALATVRHHALALADIAHRNGAKVVVGGSDPTARPDLYLERRNNGQRSVDVAVIGEGEETLVELMPLLLNGHEPEGDLAEIMGLAYIDTQEQVVRTPQRAHWQDVDSLAMPARDLVDIERYREAWTEHHGYFSLSLIATRGCPFGCTWCQKSVFGRSFRPRSPESVAEEMAIIKEQYHPDQVRIVDDVLGINRKWVRAWHDAVLDRDAVIPFECLSRADLMDEEMACLLKEAGCRRIHIGAESGSQKVLDAMNKGITIDGIRRVAELCRDLDIESYDYMMVGYPGEEWEDLQLSVKLLRETRPDVFSTTIAYPLPGTEFYEQVRDRLTFEGEQMPDWVHTAENRLLFERGGYSTLFYRWVMRWYRAEWKDARLNAGEQVPPSQRIKTWAGLWLTRAAVNVLARMPGAADVQFHPQQGE
jgi:anaerobic magnesium-protoporphyrin IX monomethyl ester cyclase